MKSSASRPLLLSPALLLTALLAARTAEAQAPPQTPAPSRGQGWDTATTVLAAVSWTSVLATPRYTYADADVTVGYKPRWHVSVLAPTMTLLTLAFVNRDFVQKQVEEFRPGCDATNRGVKGCERGGMPSTHALVSFSALGQGTGIFLVDTLKWNKGRLAPVSLVGHVVLPLVSSSVVLAGRIAGDHETASQVLLGSGAGLGLGLGMGVAYALFQRPECRFGAGIVCW